MTSLSIYLAYGTGIFSTFIMSLIYFKRQYFFRNYKTFQDYEWYVISFGSLGWPILLAWVVAWGGWRTIDLFTTRVAEYLEK